MLQTTGNELVVDMFNFIRRESRISPEGKCGKFVAEIHIEQQIADEVLTGCQIDDLLKRQIAKHQGRLPKASCKFVKHNFPSFNWMYCKISFKIINKLKYVKIDERRNQISITFLLKIYYRINDHLCKREIRI